VLVFLMVLRRPLAEGDDRGVAGLLELDALGGERADRRSAFLQHHGRLAALERISRMVPRTPIVASGVEICRRPFPNAR
jgi:hypothetical protein